MIKAFNIECKDIIYSDENLIKVNLTNNGEDSEEIWAWIGENTKDAYSKDKITNSYDHLAITANNTLNGIPWGCVIPIKLNGSNRPTSDMVYINSLSTKPYFYKPVYITSCRRLIEDIKNKTYKYLFTRKNFEFYKTIIGDDPIIVELEKYITEV